MPNLDDLLAMFGGANAAGKPALRDMASKFMGAIKPAMNFVQQVNQSPIVNKVRDIGMALLPQAPEKLPWEPGGITLEGLFKNTLQSGPVIGAVKIPEATQLSIYNGLTKIAKGIAKDYRLDPNPDGAHVAELLTEATDAIGPMLFEGKGLDAVPADRIKDFIEQAAGDAMAARATKLGGQKAGTALEQALEETPGVLERAGRTAQELQAATQAPVEGMASQLGAAATKAEESGVGPLDQLIKGDTTKSFVKKVLAQGKSERQALKELGYGTYKRPDGSAFVDPQRLSPGTGITTGTPARATAVPAYNPNAGWIGREETGRVTRGAQAKAKSLQDSIQETLNMSRDEVRTAGLPSTQLRQVADPTAIDNAINTVIRSARKDSPLRTVFGARANNPNVLNDPAGWYLLEGRDPGTIARRMGYKTTDRQAAFGKHLELLTNKVFNELGLERGKLK